MDTYPPKRHVGAHGVRPLYPLSTTAVLQAVLFAGIFLLNLFMVTDPDLWWHMATGKLIVETGSIPRTDPFSYAAAGHPWVAHEWLAEIVMYLLYRAGGYFLPVVAFAGLVTFTFWTVFRTLREHLGRSAVAASCITFWVAIMSMAGWNVRPQVFSYLFFALYLHLLLRSRVRQDRRLWLLPAIMVLWVNLHAGYVMGLLLLALFLAGEWVKGVTQHSAPSTQHPAPSTQYPAPSTQYRLGPTLYALRGQILVAFATVAATAVNPQGLSMLLYPLTYAGTGNASQKYIAEWQSPNFHDYFFFVFGASMMVLMVTSARRPTDWALGIPLLALTAMSLQSTRVIPFYALVAAPFLAQRLGRSKAFLSTQSSVLGSQSFASPQSSVLSPMRTRWNWLLLLLCLATLAITPFVSDRSQLGPEPRLSSYPAEGVRYMRDAGLAGNLFNTYHWGGFLAWSFYPERRVFIDGRADMYGDQFIEDYRTVYDARPGWKDVLDKYQIAVVLVENDGRVAALLGATGDWREAFRGEIESVFVRN